MSEEVNHADMMEEAWERLQRLSFRVQHRFQLKQKWDTGKQYALEHPFATLFVIITLAMCSVPMMCFTAFAIGTVLLTFLGFLFVEGLVLTAGTVILGGILAILAFISAIVSAGLITVWLVFIGGRQVFSITPVNIPFLSKFGFGTVRVPEEEPPDYEDSDDSEKMAAGNIQNETELPEEGTNHDKDSTTEKE